MTAAETHSVAPLCSPLVKLGINVISAACGLLGTWFMSKRYARQPLLSVLVALTWPVFSMTRWGEHVRQFVTAEANANRDIEDSAADMAAGLSFLFWAFLIQLLALSLDFRCNP